MNSMPRFLIVTAAITPFLLYAYLAEATAPGPRISELSAGGLANKHNLSAKVRAYSADQSVMNPNSYTTSNPNTYKAVDDSTNNPKGQQVCIFCHTPHSANVEGGAPLWNKNFSGETFSRYSSATLQIRINSATSTAAQYDVITQTPAWQPDGSSKLCLSCHDGVSSLGATLNSGTIAMSSDVISSDTAVSWASFKPSASAFDKMKYGHHPVSFVYDENVRVAINTGKGVSDYILPTSPVEVKLDKNKKMQCTTCHNAHQNMSHDDVCYGGSEDCTGGQANTRKKVPFWVYHGGGNNAVQDHDAVCSACHQLNSLTTPAPWPSP